MRLFEETAIHRQIWPAVLALGVASQIAQVVLLRELFMVFLGNEVAFGAILACWMFWVGTGSLLAGRWVALLRSPSTCLAASAAALLVLLPTTVVFSRFLRALFRVLPGAHLSFVDMLASCVLLLAPIGVLLGLQFVLLAKLWRERDASEDTSSASSTYVLEGAGSVLGGLLFTFLFVRFVGPIATSLVAGSLLVAGALWLRPGPPKVNWALILLLVGSLSAPLWAPRLETWSHGASWRILAPDRTLVESRQSPYGLISVLRHGEQHAFYQSGQLAFSSAAPESLSFELEEMDAAVLAHLSLLQHEDPRRLLLIGGGLRGVLREAARHPLELIHYVELDPAMIDVARERLSRGSAAALEDPRVTVFGRDGRLHVRSHGGSYDVIIVDLPDPTTFVLNRFYTREFFTEARRRLTQGGVLVIGASGTRDMRDRALTNLNTSIHHTLSQVFEQVVPLPLSGRVVFVASDARGATTSSPSLLLARHTRREIVESLFSPEYFHTLLRDNEQRRLAWVLLHHGRGEDAHLAGPPPVPLFPPSLDELQRDVALLPPVREELFVNSDLRPVGYYHALTAWDRVTRGDRAPSFDWLGLVRPSWALVLVAAALLPVAISLLLGSVRRRESSARRHAVRLAIVTTGLSTMAMQVALLLSFQSMYGVVYEIVGLIVSLFMAGLVSGAAFMKRVGRDLADWRRLAVVQGGIASFALAMTYAIPKTASLESATLVFLVFAALTFVAGLFSGLGFPVAAACHRELSGSTERAAGSTYGLELFGACAGAILASAVIAPVLGVVSCYQLSAVMNAAALLALLVSGSRHARKQA